LAFSNLSNLFGISFNAAKIVKAVRKINKNIIIILDATQSAAHIKLNLKNLDVDFMYCSFHKMFGATGVGILYFKRKYFDELSPFRLGGGMNSTITKDGYTYVNTIEKFEGGTPNISGILSVIPAIDFLEKTVSFKTLSNHESTLKKYIDEKFKSIPNIQYYSKKSKFPICAFNLAGINPQDLSNYLGSKKIIVRSGLSCAKLQDNLTGVKEGFVRASFFIYNDTKDVDKLVAELKAFNINSVVNGLI
jgi:cysteine desulfurase/selenocysteine lyase